MLLYIPLNSNGKKHFLQFIYNKSLLRRAVMKLASYCMPLSLLLHMKVK